MLCVCKRKHKQQLITQQCRCGCLYLLLLRSPQEERWTPAKKRRQMQLLMRQMREARNSHNAQVLTLRQHKRVLVGRLNSMRTRLAVLGEQLGITGRP